MKSKQLNMMLKMLSGKLINEDSANFNRSIQGGTVHRTGLELAGVVTAKSYNKYIIGWGAKEEEYLLSLNEIKRQEIIERVITKSTPLLILSKSFNSSILIKEISYIANNLKVPIFKSSQHLSHVSTYITNFLINHNTEVASIHGSLVIINGVGVLIKGKSGVGKSEAVLELIQKGHIFVSDDTVEIKHVANKFIGTPNRLTKGFLEARGIGIINIPFIYGARSVKSEATIELVINVLQEEHLNDVDRLGNQDLKYKILDSEISMMQIPAASGRSLASLMIAATNVFLAKKTGMNPIKEIGDRNKGNI